MTARPFAWPGADGHLRHTDAARPALVVNPDARTVDVVAAAAAMVTAVADVLDDLTRRDCDDAGLAQALHYQLAAAGELLQAAIEQIEQA